MSEFRYAICAAITVLATTAHAQGPSASGFTNPEDIDRAVARFTQAQIGETGGAVSQVDRRLRLASCSNELAVSWYGRPGRTIAVACPQRDGWQIYVNVRQAPAAQKSPPVIRRGDAVTIAYKGRGFTVQQQGEARGNGAIGDWIEVRTDRRAPPLKARIVRPGLVVIENS